MDNKPEPCPCCGTKVKMLYEKPQAFIVCSECKLFMARVDWEEEGDSKTRLVEAWNRRTRND